MLNTDVSIVDINLEHWKRMAALVDKARFQRRLFVVHEDGTVVKCWDTVEGNKPFPVTKVDDAQALAEKLVKENPDVYEVQVVDPVAFASHQGEQDKSWDPAMDPDDVMKRAWEKLAGAKGLGIAPNHGFLWHGLPIARLEKFIQKMLPQRCTYVMAAFDGEEIWASVIVGFEDKKVNIITTFDALPPEDLADVKGRDQHPFILQSVANHFKRPTFGWFCERKVLEDYLSAGDEDSMDEVFQKGLMEKKATFDFSVLIENGITPLGPINPGEGINGQRQG